MIMITVLTKVGTVISFYFVRIFCYNITVSKSARYIKEVCLCR